MEEYIKNINKDFYSLRNGIIADSIRKLFPADKLIFGLNIPQISDLAKKYPKDFDLGMKLWNDKKIRESRLLSLYLLPIERIDKETAKKMIFDVESNEEAEFLAFKILRYLPFAKSLYEDLSKEEIVSSPSVYCLKMFKKNLDQI